MTAKKFIYVSHTLTASDASNRDRVNAAGRAAGTPREREGALIRANDEERPSAGFADGEKQRYSRPKERMSACAASVDRMHYHIVFVCLAICISEEGRADPEVLY